MNVRLDSHNDFYDVFVPYNLSFITRARTMEGRWIDNHWRISKGWINKLNQSLQDVFFESIGEYRQRYNVEVEVMRDQTDNQNGVFIGGKEVSVAIRDSNVACCGEDVEYLEGKPTKKGGRVNYASEVKAGCKILLKDVSTLAVNYLQETKRQHEIRVTSIEGYPNKAFFAENIHTYAKGLSHSVGCRNAILYLEEIIRDLEAKDIEDFHDPNKMHEVVSSYYIPKISVKEVSNE